MNYLVIPSHKHGICMIGLVPLRQIKPERFGVRSAVVKDHDQADENGRRNVMDLLEY